MMNESILNNNTLAETPNMMNLLEQFEITDPKIQLLVNILKQNQMNSDKLIGSTDYDLAAENDEIMNRLVIENKELKANYQILEEKHYLLASALGICPDCWGEDEDCGFCHGKGRPGYLLPEKKAFTKYVRPVLERIKRMKNSDKNNEKSN